MTADGETTSSSRTLIDRERLGSGVRAWSQAIFHSRAGRRFLAHRGGVLSAIYIFVLLAMALLAPFVAPYSFETQNIDRLLQGPSAEHWFGTDALGRDVFSRVIYGARMSMAVGLLTALVSLIIGGVYGAISGWVGGWLDSVLMRLVDILDSIPSLVLLILVGVVFTAYQPFENPEIRALVGILLALSVVGWVSLARLVRGQVLQVREMQFVESAHAIGAPGSRILIHHIAPNILGPVVVMLTYQVPANILFESFLSFVGLGLQPPYASWGVLANDGWRAKSDPHLIFFPGAALFVTMLAFNFFGDALRDALDPKVARSR